MASSIPQGVRATDDTSTAAESVSWLRLVLLAVVLFAALMGLFGGGPSDRLEASSSSATLKVETPQTLRNGNFFETSIAIEARQPIADAVIALPASTWRNVTVNTMIPAATDEEYKEGEFRFHFGPLDAGERLAFKIDGQLNPPLIGRSNGVIRLLDDERELVAQPVHLTVVP